jgi:hypothetical protein
MPVNVGCRLLLLSSFLAQSSALKLEQLYIPRKRLTLSEQHGLTTQKSFLGYDGDSCQAK